MNPQELAELKKLQSDLEKAQDNYLKFLLSKNYKIRVYDSFEDSLVTAIHRDYLDEEESQWYRDWVKEDSPTWAEYGGSKILWSVNNWGLAEEIILSICQEMKKFGKVFYEANDCDGEVIEV